MEVVCKSDYQDIYRVTYGVLLIINKFEYICGTNGLPIYISHNCRSKRYSNNCQKELKVLIDDYYDDYSSKTYKAGQVIDNGYLVRLVDKEYWEYQIKTTGEQFSGNSSELLEFIQNIVKVVDPNVCLHYYKEPY